MMQDTLEALDKMTRELAAESLQEAESRAWEALSDGRYQRFGYWAQFWTYLNDRGGFHYSNPWSGLTGIAKRDKSGKAMELAPEMLANLESLIEWHELKHPPERMTGWYELHHPCSMLTLVNSCRDILLKIEMAGHT